MRTAYGKSLSPLRGGLAFVLTLCFGAAHAARAQNPPDAAPLQEAQAPQTRPAQDEATGLLMQLNLSPEQIEQMRAIRGQSVPEARAQLRRRNQARHALDEAIYADVPDEALIEQRAREVGEAEAALVRLRAQAELRVRRILTPEQLQLFRTLRQQARQQQQEQRRLRQLNGRPANPAAPLLPPRDNPGPRTQQQPGAQQPRLNTFPGNTRQLPLPRERRRQQKK